MTLLISILLFSAGCSTPVGVVRVDPGTVYRELTRNVLSAGKLSGSTENILHKYDLYELFDKDPEKTLEQLHKLAISGRGGADEIAALAELSFYHAWRTEKRSFYLASSVYSYAFLFPEDEKDSPNPYDPRLRLACDLYNRGITSGFASEDKNWFVPRGGAFELPFGKLEVTFDESNLRWFDRKLASFEPVDEFEVYGLTNRYRQSGIGAPLAANTSRLTPDKKTKDFVSDRVKVPVTAFLRIHKPRGQLTAGTMRGILELHPAPHEGTVAIADRNVPLESDPTATLASTLSDREAWEMETRGFLGDFVHTVMTRRSSISQLTFARPYKPGFIPVVFVHGTASSPGRWAEMLNELYNDPEINSKFQFWFFFYNTGGPIVHSAILLRDSLTEAVRTIDPLQKDQALQNMVVIGHSQGGLLAKMTAIDSGTNLWDGVSNKPVEELNVSEETKNLIRQKMFMKPLPFVKKVIFIATPHRGSYIAEWKIITKVTGWLVKIPFSVLGKGIEILSQDKDALKIKSANEIPTSVDNMNPNNWFIRTLISIPTDPNIHTYSIIAVQDDGPVEKGGDGVVKYKSAHIDGVDSELVVDASHSCQGDPHVIEEVRRILLLDTAAAP